MAGTVDQRMNIKRRVCLAENEQMAPHQSMAGTVTHVADSFPVSVTQRLHRISVMNTTQDTKLTRLISTVVSKTVQCASCSRTEANTGSVMLASRKEPSRALKSPHSPPATRSTGSKSSTGSGATVRAAPMPSCGFSFGGSNELVNELQQTTKAPQNPREIRKTRLLP